MSHVNPSVEMPTVISAKPLQVAKFVGILLSLALGIAGFFRLIDARAMLDGPLLGDGQFLALVLLPVVSLVLVIVVVLEALVTSYRLVQSDASIMEYFDNRISYLLLRGVEAAIAILGVALIAAALPPLFADSTPGPAGVGIMLLLFVVGIGILLASLVRSAAELFIYRGITGPE